jgi:ubiquinone/menaquinone biosynthesis C-methylase UbiE
MQNWESVWNKRTEVIQEYPIEELLRLNGYDQAQSRLTPETVYQACELFAENMGLGESDSVYELGCGSGAMLHYFKHTNHRVGGCDLSESLAKIAEKTLGGEFSSCPANEISCGGRWDHVMAFGLFMYFPDYDYAGETLIRMMIKAGKSVSIFDIPDFSKKEECENRRRELVGPEYDDKYKGLTHLYYPKEWWKAYGDSLGLKTKIYDQAIPGYENSAFRYNVTYLL